MLLILRLILLILIIRAVLMLVRGIQEGARTAGSPPAGVQLMRDPVCGVYVAPDKAITATRGAGTAYFCSEQCRQTWEREGAAKVRRA